MKCVFSILMACGLGVASMGAPADFVPAEKTGREIQSAIDRAAAAGGGRVVLEAGAYSSATLYFKSNVELHLKKGAVLLGSDRWSDCDIKTGDDCVIMRANRMPGGSSVCEDMVVENCRLDSNCQAIRLGCPSDDTIRDGLFRNLTIRGNNGIASIHPVRYLQPNCSGYCKMENLRVVDCDIDVRGQAVLFRVDPGIRLRKFGGVAFSNLVMRAGAKVTLAGTADTPLEGVSFDSVRMPGGQHGGSHGYLTDDFLRGILLPGHKVCVDLKTALDTTIAGVYAHMSAMKGGELLKIPATV